MSETAQSILCVAGEFRGENVFILFWKEAVTTKKSKKMVNVTSVKEHTIHRHYLFHKNYVKISEAMCKKLSLVFYTFLQWLVDTFSRNNMTIVLGFTLLNFTGFDLCTALLRSKHFSQIEVWSLTTAIAAP